ncbi:hypothetical protein D3C72_1165560 [compost metagenome]
MTRLFDLRADILQAGFDATQPVAMYKEAFLLFAEARVLLMPLRIQRVKLLFYLFRHVIRGISRQGEA